MFAAKVKADGRFFIATHKLEPGKEYYGVVFDSFVGQTPYVECAGQDIAFFRSDELENLPGEYRLVWMGDDDAPLEIFRPTEG